MAGTTLPGHPGVTVYPPGELPKGSYVVKNPDGTPFTDEQGNTYAGQEPGLLTKALPYIVGATFGYGALSAAGVFGGGAAAAGGGAAASAAPAVGTAASTAATAGASSWLAPALKYGLPVATNLAGNIILDKSNSSAAKIQAALTEKALDDARAQRDIDNRHYDEQIARQQEVQGYNRQNYADFSKSLEPYRANGITASDRLATLLKQRMG